MLQEELYVSPVNQEEEDEENLEINVMEEEDDYWGEENE